MSLQPGLVFDATQVLQGARVTQYRFDVLDKVENLVGHLTSVEGGHLDWSSYTAIKGSGQIEVRDIGGEIDWLNLRIRPWAIISRAGGGDDPLGIQSPLGVFIPSAPVENWDDYGRHWQVELLDKNALLDQDIVTDAYGMPLTYTAQAGANVIATVVAIIQGAGEPTPAILPDTKTLPKALVWDLGTSRLKIVNDLLDAGGYFSLWCDGYGQYQCTPYLAPAKRPPVYSVQTPFSKSDFSLMSPEWTNDRDFYSVPNRYVAFSQGSGDVAALTAVAVNMDQDSPFSYPNRGRWITRVLSDVEATDQGALEVIANRGLTATTSVTTRITAKHAFLPALLVNSTVRFTNPDADLDLVMVVGKTTMPFDPVGLCSSDLWEAVATAFGPSQTLYSTQLPNAELFNEQDYSVGMEFTFAVPGQIVALRFYRSASAVQSTHTMRIWDALGAQVQAATSTTEVPSAGWVQILINPVAVIAGQKVRISIDSPKAEHTPRYQPMAAITRGDLSVGALDTHFVAGLGGYPSNDGTPFGYLVDVVFQALIT